MGRMLIWAKLLGRRLKRLPMHLMLRDIVSWKPMVDPAEGYSVVIACMRKLDRVVIANLRLCARTNDIRMRQIILVFDCPMSEIPESVRQAVSEVSSAVRVSLLGYENRQCRTAGRIRWGWVYSWLSWCLAIAEARTRAVIIHDLDALPLSPGFFGQIYDHWSEEKVEFCGIRRYVGNGVDEGMGLVTTFELVMDAAYVRQAFRPFDLFNKLRVVGGRIVDFDTTLFAQSKSPRRTLRPIDESLLVHPSQLICQFTDLLAGRSQLSGRDHALPVLLYFMHLGGDPEPMMFAADQLADSSVRCIPFFGRMAFIDGITPGQWAWMEKQVRRIEQHLFGSTRPEVETFLRGIVRRAGESRTVGNESGEYAVPNT